MQLLGRSTAGRVLAIKGPLRDAILAKHPDWSDLIAPDVPDEWPGARYWTVMVGEKKQWLSEVGGEEDSAALDGAIDPIHLSLRPRTFIFVDEAGVFPPLPTEDMPLIRLAARARKFVDWAKKTSARLPEPLGVKVQVHDAVWQDLMERDGWCLGKAGEEFEARSELDVVHGVYRPKEYPRNPAGWRQAIHDAYREGGLELNAYASRQLFRLHDLDPARTPALHALRLVDLLSIAAIDLYRSDERIDETRLPVAWAAYTSSAAAFKLAEAITLLTCLEPDVGMAVSPVAGVWRVNTASRLVEIPSIIRTDPRVAPLVEAIEMLLPGTREADQRLASLFVEAFEHLHQTCIAHHAVQDESVWPMA
jgi:hypothetical protein